MSGFAGGVAIRRAAPSDLGAIVALRVEFERITRDSGSLDEAARRAELAALLGPDLAEGLLRCWLAEGEGRPVAQAALRLPGARSGARPGTGELVNAYTEPAYRGRGIGSALVALAVAEARAEGLSGIELQPTDDSRRIYERAGFQVDGRRMTLHL